MESKDIIRYQQMVYGDLPLGQTGFITEETPLHTSLPYSSSKAGADLFVLQPQNYGTSCDRVKMLKQT